MKAMIFGLMIGLASWQAQAEGLALQGLLGMDRGALNIGADVDFQPRQSHSVGAYFMMLSEDDQVRNQVWSLGADIKVFFGPENWRVYVAPGVGIASFDLPNNESEMTFGTVMKLGSLYEVASGVHFGLEYMLFWNWMSDDAPTGFATMNAALRFEF